jgi:hypothetical protein
VLLSVLERVTADSLGALEVVDDEGEALLRVSSLRASARMRRWADPALFPTRRETIAGIAPLSAVPDVEAYLGGWDSASDTGRASTITGAHKNAPRVEP